MKRNLKFVITGNKADGWKWDLESPNGIVLAQCVGTFKTRAAAVKSCTRITDEAQQARIILDGEDVT